MKLSPPPSSICIYADVLVELAAISRSLLIFIEFILLVLPLAGLMTQLCQCAPRLQQLELDLAAIADVALIGGQHNLQHASLMSQTQPWTGCCT